jgi:putative ABC transport system ATP-binding protein
LVNLNSLICITNLWKTYNDNGQINHSALCGVNAEIRKGEIVSLFGKSGSGKTTLLNILAGLDKPTKGTVEINGRNIFTLGSHGLTVYRRMELGFIFQFFNLLPTLSAVENVLLSLELSGRKDKTHALETLRSVGLDGKENRFSHELSGGEQQRVAVARAIVKKPSLILADEPTGNLDNKTGKQILDLLHCQCRDHGTTLIMASHSPLAVEYADRVLTIVDGVIV